VDNITTTSPGVRIAYLSEKSVEVIVMKVRLNKPVTIGASNYQEGAELELPSEQAEELIKLGVAERIDEPDEVELAEKKKRPRRIDLAERAKKATAPIKKSPPKPKGGKGK